MSPDVAAFLLEVLDRQVITVGHDGAEEIAALAFKARRGLLAAR